MESIEKFFKPDGPLAAALPRFESRPGQTTMARAVSSLLEGGGALLCEAGTGVGKTFGYLIPALLSGKKVVISTGTRNLQDQIAQKDLPLLEKALGDARPFQAALMKGRGNYLCKRRFKSFAQQPLFSQSGEGKIFKTIQEWAAVTETGDRAEIAGLPDDYRSWGDINSRTELCLGQACPSYELCFITKMRNDAKEADLVVVNHHLLFADLSVRQSAFGEVIPDYDAVFLDEAHQVEETAGSYFGRALSNHRIVDALADTERELRLAKIDDPDLNRALGHLKERTGQFFSALKAQVDGRRRLRKKDFGAIIEGAAELITTLTLTADVLGSFGKATEGVKSLGGRYRDMADLLREITSFDQDDAVYWIETRGRGVFLQMTPIDVAAHLQAELYPRAEAILFTSATLSVGGDFGYMKSRLGLEEADSLAVESPFDYGRQAVFYVAADLPEPSTDSFVTAAASRIEELLALSKGRAFCLFTSYRNMNAVYEQIAPRIAYACLIQGEAPRHEILERFREDTHSVLFATSSFWQGVDVAGEALSAVIVDRLPFASPGDPLTEARIEYIGKKGGSPFMEYQVPMAALALKQGLGRLIRSESDTGLLAVLDRRIVTKSYGKMFIESLPAMTPIKELAAVRKSVAKLLG